MALVKPHDPISKPMFSGTSIGYVSPALDPERVEKESTMNDPMTMLKDDHREASELLAKLGDSSKGTSRRVMVDKVTKALALHMQIEEKLVYPLVEREEGAEVRTEADVEHDLARDGVTTMCDMVDEPGFGAAAESLLGGLTHHIREEETEVFPKLKERLSREEWLELGDRIAAARKAGSAN